MHIGIVECPHCEKVAFIFFSATILLIGTYHLLQSKTHRYVLSPPRLAYHYYFGKTLVLQSHYHNIYIRLKQRISADGRSWVCIVLDGYMIQPVKLSDTFDPPSAGMAQYRTASSSSKKCLSLHFYRNVACAKAKIRAGLDRIDIPTVREYIM